MSDGIILPAHPLFKNLTAQRFGRLVVKAYAGRTGKRKTSAWLCECDCGAKKVVSATSLQSGTISCGCLQREATSAAKRTHGRSKSPEYHVWSGMIDRCENVNSKSYRDYGGRGINVCDRWRQSFDAFLSDMGERPGGGYEIDRVDVGGDYEPGNCRWITKSENSRNKRSNRMIAFNGRVLCSAEWSRITGIPRYTIEKRLDSGWSTERALTAPKRRWTKA